MKKLIPLTILFLILLSCNLPEPIYDNFEGKFIYSIDAPGNNPDPNDSINYQITYAKDSMLRIDNFTPIGKQSYLQKLTSDTAFLLMDLGFKKVAIRTVFDAEPTDSNYVFQYKSGSQTIAGEKARNVKVVDKERDTTMVMNYIPEISPKYSTALKGIPGLPASYSIPTKGQWIHYQLLNIERKPLNDAFFMIPPEYEIITIDEFIELIQQQ